MPNYINKKEFHDELVTCKRKGELSNKAIEYFILMAQEISKTYFFHYPEDKDDARARAVQDCYRYWKGFKESNVAQVPFEHNFSEKDKVVIEILNDRSYVFVASMNPKKINEFQICDTTNRSLKMLIAALNNSYKDKMEGFLDTIKKKLTVMDKHNADDLTIKSNLQVMQNIGGKFELREVAFAAPPNAFNYTTSIVRNAVLKAFNELYPDVHKIQNRISMSAFNEHQQRMYNI